MHALVSNGLMVSYSVAGLEEDQRGDREVAEVGEEARPKWVTRGDKIQLQP